MMRKVQNIGATRGMVSSTACSMISGVAWSIVGDVFLQQQAEAEVGLVRARKLPSAAASPRFFAQGFQRLHRLDAA